MKLLNMAAAFGMAAAMAVGPAAAQDQNQSVADFYEGKTVNLYIGYSPGGGYDTYARVLANHLGKHIPGNPTVVPQNMPGAGSLKLVNWLYGAAPQDGTAMGMVARAAPWDPLFGNEAAQFDAQELNYIGSMNNEVSVCVALTDTGIESVQDLKEEKLIVGGTGRTADTVQFPLVLNEVLGTKFEIIDGYPGGNDVVLAMERGEVEGRCGWSWSSVVSTRPDWIEQDKINVLVQLSTAKHPELPDVPLVMDLVETDDQKRLLRLVFARQVAGRPVIAPPNIPEERVDALQQAFMETMKDPEFIAEAKKLDLELNAVSGPELRQLIEESYDAPPQLVERIKKIIYPES